jgi:hypothetical protein
MAGGGDPKPPSQWDLLRAAEKLAPRFTLGDVMLQLPTFGVDVGRSPAPKPWTRSPYVLSLEPQTLNPGF